MLRLVELRVKNFRSVRAETFLLSPLTILVGKNDVGKSNILEAIEILFEGTSTSVEVEDFYDPSEPLELIGVLEGLPEYLELCDEKNRKKIEDRIDDNSLFLIRRLAQSPRSLGKIEIHDPRDGEFSTPTGIDAAIKPLLPEVVFIEALADVSEETKGTQKDALGKLMGQVLSSIATAVQPSLEQAYDTANKLLNVQQTESFAGTNFEDERVEELRVVESEITRYLQETFPAASVRLRVQLPSVKEILGNVDVFVRERAQEDPYYRRGQGLQRALYLSLLRALASRIRETQEKQITRPFVLLFEEPEAFLHPEGQIKMRSALDAIATEAQVVISTHSPLLVTPDAIDRTVRIEKQRDESLPKPFTKRWGPIEPNQLPVAERELLRLFAIQRSSRFLFCRGVVLVEGVGDEHIFVAAARRLKTFDFEAREIAIVETGGKDMIVPFMQVLRKLGLQTWAVVDIDFLWNGAGNVLGGDPQLAQFCERLTELVPASEEAQPTEGARIEARRQRKEACLTELAGERDSICDRLQEYGTFVLRHGEMEDYVGLGHRSKSQYLKAASDVISGQRDVRYPEDIIRVLEAIDPNPKNWSTSDFRNLLG